MELLNAAAGLGTSLLDQYGDLLFGGQLQKAKLVAYSKPYLPGHTPEGQTEASKELSDLSVEFFLNPETLSISKSLEVEEIQTAQNRDEVRYQRTRPIEMDIPDLWFDTYETRKNVRKEYIERLENLVDFYQDTHHSPAVMLVWGKFTEETQKSNEYLFYVTGLKVVYAMFLPDGTPVRAKVSLTLQQAAPGNPDQKNSPDHAKLYTVRRGDTLQGIAAMEYDDPREWRRIAETNDIDDPMSLKPGTKLLVPPILK